MCKLINSHNISHDDDFFSTTFCDIRFIKCTNIVFISIICTDINFIKLQTGKTLQFFFVLYHCRSVYWRERSLPLLAMWPATIRVFLFNIMTKSAYTDSTTKRRNAGTRSRKIPPIPFLTNVSLLA